MAIDLNLTDIQSGFLTATAYTANNTLIEQALQKALNREGGANNEMLADLDMGLNNIINVENIDVNSITIDGTDYSTVLQGFVDDAAALAQQASDFADAASSSADSANQSYLDTKALSDQFRGTYYGEAASDPAQDPLGNPVSAGDLYYNTTDNKLYVYNGNTEAWAPVEDSFTVDANQVFYDNTSSGYTATNVQDAIDNFSSSATGNGSDLVSHTGTTDTVTEALDKRTVFVESMAELEGLLSPKEGQQASVQGSVFVYESSAWVAKGSVSAIAYQLEGVTSATTWQAAIDDAISKSVYEFVIPFDVSTLDGPVDCGGLRLICSGTTLPSSINTLTNHSGVVNGVIAGVNTSDTVNNVSRSPEFQLSKFIRRTTTNEYQVFGTKKNPAEGYLQYLFQENNVTTANSIGGNSATRITQVNNVADCIAHKHTYATASGYTPSDSTTRVAGGGTGGTDIAFWDIPPAGVLRFNSDVPISELSILFLSSGLSSDDVEIRWQGVTLDTISLVQGSGTPDYFIYRKSVLPVSGQLTLINNSATDTAYVAGINAYRPGEDSANEIGELGYDRISYSLRSTHYANPNGAVDYALRRHPDTYAGTDPTGGSYHGGETVNSQTVRLDGGDANSVPAVSGIKSAKRIEFVKNVDVTWPSDMESVQVICLTQIADGGVFKDLEIRAGDMVFDAVWTTLWTTPVDLSVARGLTERGTSSVNSEFRSFDRGNEIKQENNVSFAIRNTFTLFDNERNTIGGPYIASSVSRNKLYYGPILFNKGSIGTISAQQYTEFYGSDI